MKIKCKLDMILSLEASVYETMGDRILYNIIM